MNQGTRNNILAELVFILILFSMTLTIEAQTFGVESSLSPQLPACNMTTVELQGATKDTVIDSCLLYDNQHQILDANMERTTVITAVGVFDSSCDIEHDGAMVAVEMFNRGNGASIGYNKDYFIKFRLVIAIAGNSKQQTSDDYKFSHTNALEGLIVNFSPQYILGSCSFYARYDKELAGKYNTMLLSQVGPQKFYQEDSNEHVFGVHIPSELYGIPAFQALQFANKEQEKKDSQKIRIIHRDRSEFFNYTCRSVYDKAMDEGFSETIAIEYNPEADEDGDGLLNQEDEDFLKSLADQACAEDEAMENVAIWVCVQHDFEINTILDRLLENGCHPSLFWSTKASVGWANKFIERVPYFQAGAQWHRTMDYSDEFFESGQAMLDYLEGIYGYSPSYGAMGSYHAIYIMYKNLWSFFKTQDSPEVESTLQNSYEELRRSMLDLSIPKSLYGPTIFDSDQRNVGRGSAASQWLLPESSSTGQPEMLLVSPDTQASAAVVYPAPSSLMCQSGAYINKTLVSTSSALLESKCSMCIVDTYQPVLNVDTKCHACPPGSSTAQETGADICVKVDENLIAPWLVIIGMTIVGVNFLLAIIFAAWTIYFRNDPVVWVGQMEFLVLLCVGSTISSSAIIPLAFQAGTLEDTTAASGACAAVPFLYATGVTLQYSALFAKSFRMYQVMDNARRMRRVKVTAKSTLIFVLAAVLLNWAVIIPWTIVDTFHWERFDLGYKIDETAGVITHESIGTCTSENFGIWTGTIFVFHMGIVIVTNIVLWKLRFVNDRYQESNYVSLASFFAFIFLLMGIPILVAVRDSASLRYMALIFIIAMSDTIILLMIFVPKIRSQREGLPENTTVTQSIFRQPNASGPRAGHTEIGRNIQGQTSQSENKMNPASETKQSKPDHPIAETRLSTIGEQKGDDSDNTNMNEINESEPGHHVIDPGCPITGWVCPVCQSQTKRVRVGI